jgi:hypothetical protein
VEKEKAIGRRRRVVPRLHQWFQSASIIPTPVPVKIVAPRLVAFADTVARVVAVVPAAVVGAAAIAARWIPTFFGEG